MPAADVKAVPGDIAIPGQPGPGYSGFGLSGFGLSGFGVAGFGVAGFGGAGVVEAAEEERGVGDVFERFGPVIEVGLEEFLGHGVPAHGLEGEHVLAHHVQEFPGAPQLVALGGQDRVGAGSFGMVFCIGT